MKVKTQNYISVYYQKYIMHVKIIVKLVFTRQSTYFKQIKQIISSHKKVSISVFCHAIIFKYTLSDYFIHSHSTDHPRGKLQQDANHIHRKILVFVGF